MYKAIIVAVMATATLGLAACSGFNESPEQVQFKKFQAECKANPSSAACVEYANSKKEH
jgi:hypothetical protein